MATSQRPVLDNWRQPSMSPAMKLRSVLLPQPDGPRIARGASDVAIPAVSLRISRPLRNLTVIFSHVRVRLTAPSTAWFSMVAGPTMTTDSSGATFLQVDIAIKSWPRNTTSKNATSQIMQTMTPNHTEPVGTLSGSMSHCTSHKSPLISASAIPSALKDVSSPYKSLAIIARKEWANGETSLIQRIALGIESTGVRKPVYISKSVNTIAETETPAPKEFVREIVMSEMPPAAAAVPHKQKKWTRPLFKSPTEYLIMG
mmetsp:Transcript_94447/g.272026  ORF Transcript_94447/g.272026 Transcript_94447/m.272026 type:complete len:258 (+) Transcript_94447:700-1473(+)